jgi:hypothetical protein
MYIIGCVQLELYINNFGGTKLKRNYIWGYATKVEEKLHLGVRYQKTLNTAGLERLRKITYIRNADVLARVRTEYLPNTRLQTLERIFAVVVEALKVVEMVAQKQMTVLLVCRKNFVTSFCRDLHYATAVLCDSLAGLYAAN